MPERVVRARCAAAWLSISTLVVVCVFFSGIRKEVLLGKGGGSGEGLEALHQRLIAQLKLSKHNLAELLRHAGNVHQTLTFIDSPAITEDWEGGVGKTLSTRGQSEARKEWIRRAEDRTLPRLNNGITSPTNLRSRRDVEQVLQREEKELVKEGGTTAMHAAELLSTLLKKTISLSTAVDWTGQPTYPVMPKETELVEAARRVAYRKAFARIQETRVKTSLDQLLADDLMKCLQMGGPRPSQVILSTTEDTLPATDIGSKQIFDLGKQDVNCNSASQEGGESVLNGFRLQSADDNSKVAYHINCSSGAYFDTREVFRPSLMSHFYCSLLLYGSHANPNVLLTDLTVINHR